MATSAGEIEVKLSLTADDFQNALKGSATAVKSFGDDVSKNLDVQLGDATAGLNGVVGASKTMEGQFSHRFEHVGLQLFATDLLRTSGLGTEARGILSTLQLAMNSAGMAFGAAAGPIMLVVAGLTAVAGIAMKVVSSHQDILETLKTLHDETQKQIASADDEIISLTKWKDAVGRLTPALQALLESEQKLRAENILSQESTNLGKILSLNEQIAKEKELMSVEQQEADKLKAHMGTLAAVLKPGMEGYTMLERDVQAYDKATKALSATALKLATDQKQLNAVIAEQIDLHKGVTASIEKQSATAVTDAADELKDAKDLSDAIEAELKRRQEAYVKMQAGIDAVNEEGQKFNDLELKKMEASVNHTVSQIGSEFGNAFAQMIVEGKSFADSMEQAFTRMAEQIIAKIIQMIAEWAIFSAMTGMGGSIGIFGAAGLKNLGFAAAAEGGMITEPSIITGLRTGSRTLAGEAGPEAIVPMGSGGQGGQGGNITVNVSISGQLIEGNKASWQQIVNEKIIPAIRRATMSNPTGPFNRTRGVV